MEWIISALIALLIFWCGYCVVDHFQYQRWYSEGDVHERFKYWGLLTKLEYITYQIVKWITLVVTFGLFGILIIIAIKLAIFGR